MVLKPVPWQNEEEALQTLRQWFYPEYFASSSDMRHKAVSRVQAYKTRGTVPHSVEITALLTSAWLSDQGSVEPSVVRLAYSMALIR